MAKKSCSACGAPVSPGEEFCSYCGALVPRNQAAAQTAGEASAQAVRYAPAPEEAREKRRVQTPRTIDELTAFCERHQLPLAKMRFFIGLDYPGAKAYGIYRDRDGQFVVYKNKADGSRAVRYRGPDEAYAVNEIFQKLKEEAGGQRARVAAARTGYPASPAHDRNPYNRMEETGSVRTPRKRKSSKLLILLLGAAAAITIARTAAVLNPPKPHPSTGYYHYNDNYYYNQNDNWYQYSNDFGTWYPIYSVDDELADNYYDYYTSYSYDEGYGVDSFADSSYYDDYGSGSGSYSGDWDSGSSGSYSSDWDSGSSGSWDWDWDDDDDWDSSSDWDWDSDWDSDFGDWDSDW